MGVVVGDFIILMIIQPADENNVNRKSDNVIYTHQTKTYNCWGVDLGVILENEPFLYPENDYV